jgi:CheY-like chemotaxis protein
MEDNVNKPKKEKIVFVVDDDRIIQHFLEYSLIGKEGCTVKIFSKAEDCLNNLDLQPDLIILDHSFIGIDESLMTGLEALIKIRDINKTVPVIVLSQSQDDELINEYVLNGASTYIPKEGTFLNTLIETFEEIMN